MLTPDKTMEIFCIIDEFYKGILEDFQHFWISK